MKKFKITLLIAGLLVFLFTPVFAQDKEAEEPAPPETYMSVVMVKQGDGSRMTTVTLTAIYEDHREPITGAEIILTAAGDSGDIELTRSETMPDGVAELLVPAGLTVPKDGDGYFNFTVTFEGNDVFGAASETITIRDFVISLRAELVDSVRTLIVEAYGIGAPDSLYPFHEEEIGIFIQGMLSKLPLEAVWMEEGYGEIVFPDDLPGDKDGNLTIYAAVLEHGEYGNVETSVAEQWGTGFEHSNELGRALWGADAPWWMIIVLIILISGVWGHYLFAMIQIGRVRKLGNDS